MRIKVTDLDYVKFDQLHISEDSIYFMGHKEREMALCYIHVYYFFSSVDHVPMVNVAVAKDQPPPQCRVVASHGVGKGHNNKDTEFLYLKDR
ncbi:unnamed protein product [Sphagnum balticum]